MHPVAHRTAAAAWIAALSLVGVGCAGRPPSLADARLVDLTHAYDADTVYWPTEDGFQLEVESAGTTPAGYFYASNRFCSAEHGGTHLDAPYHFAEHGDKADEIPLTRLVGEGVLVDVAEASARDADHEIGVDDLRAWESRHGEIPPGAIVLLRTGFGRYWPDRARYLGTTELGAPAVAKLHFPGLHPDGARFLVTERRVKAVGLDTASIDTGQSTRFASHVLLFAANVPVFENLANLDQLPPRGFEVIALPMKIRGGTGGPLRVVAVLR